jgi:hypothetical protein
MRKRKNEKDKRALLQRSALHASLQNIFLDDLELRANGIHAEMILEFQTLSNSAPEPNPSSKRCHICASPLSHGQCIYCGGYMTSISLMNAK